MTLKILMISKSGDGLGIAQKLKEDGHDVAVWVKEKGFDFASLGIVKRPESWRPLAGKWADLVFADMVGFGNFEKVLNKMEVPHFGFNPVADMMELDRQKQSALFKRARIRTPETHDFDSPRAALELLPVFKNGFVIKPSGNLDTGKTFICRNKDTFKWALEQFSGDQELIVQRIVEGVEVSTEGWFDGRVWLEPFNHTFEEKKFLEGNLGPNTGCMGNVVIPIKERRNILVGEIKKLTPFLRAANYRGPIDLNAIVNEQGTHALELTARIGYDAIEALHTIMEEPIAALFLGIAEGNKQRIMLKDGLYGMAVRLTVPPYPNEGVEIKDRGLPILGVPQDRGNYYLTDVYEDDNMLRWAAADGVLMKVTGAAVDLKMMQKITYANVNKVTVLGLQYRRDIGVRVEGDLKALAKMGIHA